MEESLQSISLRMELNQNVLIGKFEVVQDQHNVDDDFENVCFDIIDREYNIF